ncbi:thiolase family protein [Streptomyces sp. 8N706]|uniref:thiolase family protein n=1 Tax=Streptomyces sp. 8N706 TaxID=3457416 RepID=UPI003FCF34CF
MRQAVVVSTARTAIGKAHRGAFDNPPTQELAAHAIAHAVRRAWLEGGEVEDVILGRAVQHGSSGGNVARRVVLRTGLPETVPGMTMCIGGGMGASGLSEVVS